MTLIALLLSAALYSLSGACTMPHAPTHTALPPDSTGAVIDLRQDGSDLHVRALYVNDGDYDGALTYKLDVTRGGRSQSTNRQSGRFTTSAGTTDTLSTTRISVRPGDPVSIHLTVSNPSGVVDDVRLTPEIH